MNGPNPSRYRRLSEPHASPEAFNEAFEKFYEELDVLREKYRMRDLVLIVAGSALTSDGGEGEFMTHLVFGDPTKAQALCAFAYGREAKDRVDMVSKLLKGGVER